MVIRQKQIEQLSAAHSYSATDHFLGTAITGGSLSLVNTTASGGGNSTLAGSANSPGIARLTTGVQAVGSTNLRTSNTAIAPPGTTGLHNYSCRFRYRLPNNPVSATEGCLWIMGFGNSTGAGEPATGAYLYIDNSDGLQYFGNSRGGVRTYSTGDQQPINTWLECGITLQRNGRVRYDMQFGGEEGSFYSVFINTNVPTASVGLQFGMLKSAGTTPQLLDLDFVSFSIDRLPPPT